MALILRKEGNANVTTPPDGSGAIFISDVNDAITVKSSTGNISSILTFTADTNTEVFFNDSGELGQANTFTFDKANGIVTVGGIKTDDYFYANGEPLDFEQPAGNTTEIQFNNNGDFGASPNLRFNDGNSVLAVQGTISANTIDGTLSTAIQPNITSVGNLSSLNVTGGITGGNLETPGNLSVSGNAIISGDLAVNGNITYINVENFSVEDPIIALGGGANGSALTGNDGKDRGLQLHYYTTEPVDAFMGWDNSNSEFVLASNASIDNNQVIEINSLGNVRARNFLGNVSGVTGSFSGNIEANNISATDSISAFANVSAENVNGNFIYATSNAIVNNMQVNAAFFGNTASFTGNVSAINANLGNLVEANFYSGVLISADQPNVTSLGTLLSLQVGSTANANVFANAKTISSQDSTGESVSDFIGLVGEAVGDNAAPGSSAIGLLGIARTDDTSKGTGVQGVAVVTSTDDLGAAVGVRGYSTSNHAAGYNIGVLGNAIGSDVGNYAFYIQNGGIASIENSTFWDLTDDSNAALTFNSTGKANIFGIETTDNSEGIFTSGYLNVVGNAVVGGIKTDNYFYANGEPVDFEQPAGLNNQIQFNDDNDFGASANLTFDPSTNELGINGTLNVSGNANVGNIIATDGVFTTIAGDLVTNAQPNVTSVGTLTSLDVTGNVSAGNVSATGVTATTLGGSLTTASQPNVTSVGTLESLSVTGNTNLATINATNAVFSGSGSFGANLNMNDFHIINLSNPNGSKDAATKEYVDEVAQGLKARTSAKVLTDFNLVANYDNGNAGVGSTLTATTNVEFPTIDGVSGLNVESTRVLVIGQDDAIENGLYVLDQIGITGTQPWVLRRCQECDESSEIPGSFVFIKEGDVYGSTGWVAIVELPFTIGSDPITWTQFSGSGTFTAGEGLTLTGTEFSINTAQPTITSLGTLTGLSVNGNVIAGNITANTGVFAGNGSGLTNLAGANVTGQVGNALVSGTVYTAAQPNITSVGSLTSLVVTGNASAGNLSTSGTLSVTGNANLGNIGATNGVFTSVSGNGSALSALNASNLASGTVPSARLSGSYAISVTSATTAGTVTTAAQPNITSVGTLTALSVTGNANVGNITATNGVFTSVSGNGSALTALNANSLASGTVPSARLSGSYAISVTSATTAGTVTTAAQPNITSVGTLTALSVTGNANVGNIGATNGVFTSVSGNGSALTALNASNLASGTVPSARLSGSYAISVTSATTAGTVTTAAQPNITSVGTLSSLSVTGNANVGNIGATNGVFTSVSGNGSGLSALNGSNISSGTIAAARIATLNQNTTGSAATVTTAAQPNITSVGTLTSLAISGTNTLTVRTISTGANTTTGTITGNWSLSAGSRLNATYADLAECYVADQPYEPGTVLLFAGEHEVSAEGIENSHAVAGVVSTKPAYLMNSECQGEHVVELALIGRVPCKVQGPVNKGDLIVSSDKAGYGKVNNEARAGTIVGKALSTLGNEEGTIEILVGRS